MKTSNKYLQTLLGATLINIMACAPKVEEKKIEPLGISAQEAKVNGPDITGSWMSSCILPQGMENNFQTNERRRVYLLVGKGQVEYRVIRYQDPSCEIEKMRDVYKGAMEYERELNSSAFIAEIQTPIGNNVTSLLYFVVTRNQNQLNVSDLTFNKETLSTASQILTLRLLSAEAPQPSNPAVPNQNAKLNAAFFVPENKQEFCSLSVSTSNVGATTTQVWLDQDSPCATTQITLSCQQGVCARGQTKLEILNPSSFRLTIGTKSTIYSEQK